MNRGERRGADASLRPPRYRVTPSPGLGRDDGSSRGLMGDDADMKWTMMIPALLLAAAAPGVARA